MATQSKTEATCRVLVVEDEIAVAIHLEDLLIENGYDVINIAMTVEQALDCLERHSPDVVLLDLDLHGTRATPVAAKLRAMGIPFVVETAHASDTLTGTPFQDAALVQKPWKEQDLLRCLSDILHAPEPCEPAQSATVFAFPADRSAAKAQPTERDDLIKTGRAARSPRLLPIRHDKIAAAHPAGSGSHFPGLPGTCSEHIELQTIHGEAAEFTVQPRRCVVPKARGATPGLSAGQRDTGLKHV